MDEIIRAVAGGGFVSIAAISSRGLTERAKNIHKASRVCTAALGRVMAAASVFGSAMKRDGASVTVRVNGGGPIGTIIAVSDNLGNVRCCAGNPEIELPIRLDGKLDVGRAVGKNGTLTVIRDAVARKRDTNVISEHGGAVFNENEPYSGSTALVSGEIAEDFTAYLAESEQAGAACALGVLIGGDGIVRAAGGYIVSLLPDAPEDVIAAVERNIAETGYVTSVLDGGSAEELISRVMRGLEPKILSRDAVEYKCGCSRERVASALAGIGKKEREDIIAKGEDVEVTCRFCDAVYTFSPAEIKKISVN
ncbi:MAG: Hsp33 family molecular chaperone HslO [Oscillospiraceae bacterium]|nr:Hsp33 family molecular chaperone HslO [Oscillospiraceae bacterium]